MFFDSNRSTLSYIRRNTMYIIVLCVIVLCVIIISAIVLNQNKKRMIKIEKELIELIEINEIVKEGCLKVI